MNLFEQIHSKQPNGYCSKCKQQFENGNLLKRKILNSEIFHNRSSLISSICLLDVLGNGNKAIKR